jgi:hypothetical protein
VSSIRNLKILTENSKSPLSRALALASFLGSDYPPTLGGARTAPPSKDHMAFGSVLAHNQHNIGKQLAAGKKMKKKKIFATAT